MNGFLRWLRVRRRAIKRARWGKECNPKTACLTSGKHRVEPRSVCFFASVTIFPWRNGIALTPESALLLPCFSLGLPVARLDIRGRLGQHTARKPGPDRFAPAQGLRPWR